MFPFPVLSSDNGQVIKAKQVDYSVPRAALNSIQSYRQKSSRHFNYLQGVIIRTNLSDE